MHGLARPIGNRLTPHSSGEVRPQISELARVHRSHGPDREQREQADQEPGQRRPTEEQTRAQRDRRCRNWAAQTPTPAMAGGSKLSSLLTDRSRTAPMNQRKAMPARPQHRRVRPVAEQARRRTNRRARTRTLCLGRHRRRSTPSSTGTPHRFSRSCRSSSGRPR